MAKLRILSALVVQLINADNITYDMVMEQLSIAFQGALIAFPPR